MLSFTHDGVTLFYRRLGADTETDTQLIFAHGWGQSGEAFVPLAQSFSRRATTYLIDFPGFGQSPKPPDSWGTEDYGYFMAAFLDHLPRAAKRLWIGHSFGCRVGLRLAAQSSPRLDALILIAAAGLPRPLPWYQRPLRACRSLLLGLYRFLRQSLISESFHKRLKQMASSPDYRSAGDMREIFTNTVSENLSELSRQVYQPTLLVYGLDDRETPPAIGRRYAELMPKGRFIGLPGFNHYTILTDGRHQIVSQIDKLIGAL